MFLYFYLKNPVTAQFADCNACILNSFILLEIGLQKKKTVLLTGKKITEKSKKKQKTWHSLQGWWQFPHEMYPQNNLSYLYDSCT